jgi:hypothetical protein
MYSTNVECDKLSLYHHVQNSILCNEFVCKLGSLWHEWASLKRSRPTRHQTLEAINIDRPTRHQKKKVVFKDTPRDRPTRH